MNSKKYILILLLTINFSCNMSQKNNDGVIYASIETNKNVLVEINVLDKVSSKNTILKLNIGEEKKIKEAILYDVSTSNMDDKISDVLVPSENIVEMRDGKKKIKERVF